MALKIRLARGGAKKRPYYRIVVAEASAPRDGRFVEKVGTYNPMLEKAHPDHLRLVEDRIKHWLSVGATPTDRVARFLGQAKIIAMPTYNETPQKSQPKQKTQERMKEREEREAAKAAAAAAPAPEPVAEETASAAVEPEAPVEAPAAEAEAPAAEPAVEEAAPAAPEPAAEEASEPAAEAEAPAEEA